jgi:hypothetical protein
MPYGFKVFGDGILPASKATLVTIQTNHSGIASVRLTNTGSTTIKVNIYANSNGTSRHIGPKDLELGAQEFWPGQPEELEEGDTIEGEASVGGFVSYRIAGIDRE